MLGLSDADEASSFYFATLLLDPERLVGAPNEFGHIIIIPRRDTTFSFDMDFITGGDISVMRDQLVTIAAQNFETYNGSSGRITPNMFWWNGSSIQMVTVTESTILFPPELDALIN